MNDTIPTRASTTFSRLRHTRLAAAALLGLSAQAAFAQTILEETVVTGTRVPFALSEAPVRTEVVGRESIEARNARTFAEAIEYTTGLRVESNCQNCNFSQVRLLGLDGNFTQILTDSRPALSSLAAVYGIEQIPAALIDRIEIVKGGASALYGPGAVAGVINIIPREPLRTGGELTHVQSYYDGRPSRSDVAVFDLVTPDGRLGATVFGQTDRVQSFDENGDGFSEVTRRRLDAGGIRAIWTPFTDFRFTFDYQHFSEQRRGGSNDTRGSIFDLPRERVADADGIFQGRGIAEDIQSELDTFALTLAHRINESVDYRLTAQYQDVERDSYYGTGSRRANADGSAGALLGLGASTSQSMFYEALVNVRFLDVFTLTLGGQYDDEKLIDNQGVGLPQGRAISDFYRNVGGFAQLIWQPTTQWDVIGGLRVDQSNSVEDLIYSPRFALAYRPVKGLALRASYAAGFRPPELFDEDLHIEVSGGDPKILRNAAGLKEETSNTFTVGVEWRPEFTRPARAEHDHAGHDHAAHEHGGKKMITPATRSEQPLLFEVNLFATTLTDVFTNIEVLDGGFVEKQNGGDAAVYGAEFNFGWQITPALTFELGYVEQVARFSDPQDLFSDGSVVVRDFQRTPNRYGQATLRWKNDWFSTFLGARVTGPMEVPYEEEGRLVETSDYFVEIDAAISRDWKLAKDVTLTTTVGVKNLTDAYQDDLDRGFDRDAGYVYGPRFPRMVYLSGTIKF